MLKRVFQFILITVITISFCSCQSTDITVTKESTFSVINNNSTDFVIVRPEGDSDIMASIRSLRKEYISRFNVELQNISDSTARNDEAKEIIIGNTKRPESAKALEILQNRNYKNKDFIICVIDGNIVINAINQNEISTAIEYFINNYIDKNSFSTTLRDIQEDKNKYNCLSINGTELSTTISISFQGYQDSFLVKSELSKLEQLLIRTFGLPVTVTENDGGLIVIGSTSGYTLESKNNRDNYSITIKSGKILVDGGSDYSLAFGIKELINTFSEGNVSFSDGFSKVGKYSETANNNNPDNGRTLVWNHEFEVNSVSELSSHFINTQDHMRSNDENLVTSMDEDCFFTDGKNMVLRTYSDGNRHYTTARSVSTATTMCFRYGYLEMRAIVPYMNCVWPSFWMKHEPLFRQSVNRGEIDIFEVFASENTAVPNLHKHLAGSSSKQIGNKGNILLGQRKYTFENTENLNSTYHIYGFEWTPEYMAFYIDGEVYYKIGITEEDDYCADERPGMDCFHEFYYVCFNNWVFTEQNVWSWATENQMVERNPDFGYADYIIDYVRLYQSPNSDERIAVNYSEQ